MNLSPSKLGVFKNCPRCFWLQENRKVKQPRGIFPSLPGGIDRVLKDWFDQYRLGVSLPPEIAGQLDGSLYTDQAKLDKWRNWRSGLSATVGGHVISGALDDLHMDVTGGLYSPLDYKSRGAPQKGESARYYGHQMDLYALMIQANGMPITGKAYLVYYWPLEVRRKAPPGNHANIVFGTEVVTLDADPNRATKMVMDAAACLQLSKPPQAMPDCDYCTYVRNIRAALREMSES